ncbi:MAG: DUF1624 domain-containing protein [DPANN group archaeon]|nr:DUF1624 domain-containing protein [DPANN group archaeon]
MQERFYEIDALRGIAIIFMIFYHTLYDLNYFTYINFNLWSGPFWFIGRTSATIFILLVGISLTISFSKIRNKYNKTKILQKYILRGAKIFSLGLMITAMTYLFLDKGTIYFGILHFIGLSIIIIYPFLKLKNANLILGSAIIATGLYLKTFTINIPYFLFLGLRPESFYTLDYFPLLPWFGIILIGIYFGHTFYPDGKRKIKIPKIQKYVKPLTTLGQKSLIIYIIHQPILIFIIYILL